MKSFSNRDVFWVVYFENLNRWVEKKSKISAFFHWSDSFLGTRGRSWHPLSIIFNSKKNYETNVVFLLQRFKIKKNILGLETWERCAGLICLSKTKNSKELRRKHNRNSPVALFLFTILLSRPTLFFPIRLPSILIF